LLVLPLEQAPINPPIARSATTAPTSFCTLPRFFRGAPEPPQAGGTTAAGWSDLRMGTFREVGGRRSMSNVRAARSEPPRTLKRSIHQAFRAEINGPTRVADQGVAAKKCVEQKCFRSEGARPPPTLPARPGAPCRTFPSKDVARTALFCGMRRAASATSERAQREMIPNFRFRIDSG
jgi:hypothetical protein